MGSFCHWYNVGWVVCRSPGAAERWARLPMAKVVARLKEGGQPVVVYALDRRRSFVLSGSAKWEQATPRRVVLTDVHPDEAGGVVLSLHTEEGLRVYPSYIQLDPNEDPAMHDPIKLVRLRLHGPVPRVTLVWEHP